MIKTARQLKDLVRNRSKGNSAQAQIIIRNYIMERFLERVSLSKYRSNLIFKGGLLVSSIVGLDNRSTMDIDTTLKNINLSECDVERIVSEIIAIPVDDGVTFTIKKISNIMDEAEYPGVRVSLDAAFENMHTPVKLNFSTGDVVTPHEIEYSYQLMFEKRSIPIMAYNVETMLAEKLETIITRGTANTRLRDFYDLRILNDTVDIHYDDLKAAFKATCQRGSSESVVGRSDEILEHIKADKNMQELWENYRRKYEYARDYLWLDVMSTVFELVDKTK